MPDPTPGEMPSHSLPGARDPATSDFARRGVPIDPSRADAKWSDDAFLDRLRAGSDDFADRSVAACHAGGLTGEESGRIFAAMDSSDAVLPEESPAAMKEFFAATNAVHQEMEKGFDVERLDRGKEVFHLYTVQSCVVMLASSLPCGYSAPCLSRVLTVSDDLQHHPYRRLLGVLQLLVNIYRDDAHHATPLERLRERREAFLDGRYGDQEYGDREYGDEHDAGGRETRAASHDAEGYAFLTAQKLRLLHAGIRPIVRRHRPDFEETYGIPVNHEDMLATIMGFSLLVVEGCQSLGVEFTRRQVDDVWYLWRQFTRMMGITPADDPLSEELVPQTIDDAAAFYESYVRRHYAADPADNPDGVALVRRNLEMMRDLLPKWGTRCLGMGRIPLIAMQETLGQKGMIRVGIQPLSGHEIDLFLFDLVGRFLLRGETRHPDFFSRFGMVMLGEMIEGEMGGEVTFLVPADLADVRSLTEVDGPAVDDDER